MTREQKLEAIYAEIANKEISFGCRVETEFWRNSSIVEETADERWYIVVSEESLYNDEDLGAYYCWLKVRWLEAMEKIDIAKIIWHPVMIGDVLRQIRLLAGYALDNDLIKKSDFGNVIAQHNYRITQIWEDFREPIESQSDECIDYVYSLIPSKSME